MAFAIIPLSMKAYVTATAESGDYTLYALKFVSNNEDEDDIEGVQAIYTAEDLQIPLISTQQMYGTYYNPIDDGDNYIFKAAYLGDKFTATVAKDDTETSSGEKAMVFTNDNAEERLLPVVTAEDVGKTVVVNDDGEWELGNFPEELPDTTGASRGDVLTIGSSGLEWATPSGGGGLDVVLTKPQSGSTYTCNHTNAEILDAIYNNIPISACVIDLASSLTYNEKTYHPRYIGFTKISMASNGQVTFEIFTPYATSAITTDYIMISRFNVTITTNDTITGTDNSYALTRYKFS